MATTMITSDVDLLHPTTCQDWQTVMQVQDELKQQYGVKQAKVMFAGLQPAQSTFTQIKTSPWGDFTAIRQTTGPSPAILSLTQLSDEKKAPPKPIEYYLDILYSAKDPALAKTGDYTISKDPITGNITIGCKDMLGFYGITFKPDGSIVQISAPGNGGSQEILPPGSLDFDLAEAAYTLSKIGSF